MPIGVLRLLASLAAQDDKHGYGYPYSGLSIYSLLTCPSRPRCRTRFRDPSILQRRNPPLSIDFFCDDDGSGLQFACNPALAKLQELPQKNDRNVGAQKPDLLDAISHRTSLIDRAKDHAMAGFNRSASGVISAQNVNEIGFLGEECGKARAVSSIPRGFQLIHHLVQCAFFARHLSSRPSQG